MQLYEILSLLIFAGFWLFIYANEAFLLASKFRHETLVKSKFRKFIHVLSVIGIVCFLYAYFVEPYWVDIRYIDVQTNKLNNTTFTLVQISDLHCDKKVRSEHKVVEIVNKINPDVIVFTGDALNSPEALLSFQNTLRELRADLGKFAVRGNWDVWYWNRLDLFKGTNFIELNKTFQAVEKNGEKITISGLAAGSPWEGLVPSENQFNVFLYHYPDLIEDIAPLNVDLYLAGHTHGGQVALPFYGAIITLSKFGKKYEAGEYKFNNTILYVNRGIGMEGGLAPRIRFFARPEITVFKIEP